MANSVCNDVHVYTRKGKEECRSMKKLFEKWNSISLILRIVCGLTIGVLTWGVIIGVGMRAANDTTKKVLDDISNGLSQVVSWIISMAPFGILGLVFSSISSNGLEIFTEYGKLLLVLVGSMLFIYFVTNPFIVFLVHPQEPVPADLQMPEEECHYRIFHQKLRNQYSGKYEGLRRVGNG